MHSYNLWRKHRNITNSRKNTKLQHAKYTHKKLSYDRCAAVFVMTTQFSATLVTYVPLQRDFLPAVALPYHFYQFFPWRWAENSLVVPCKPCDSLQQSRKHSMVIIITEACWLLTYFLCQFAFGKLTNKAMESFVLTAAHFVGLVTTLVIAVANLVTGYTKECHAALEIIQQALSAI